MTGAQILENLTDEQAYTLLMKAQRHAETLPEPAWSQTEGHWQRATASGAVNGKSPMGMITRAEAIAVMGRNGVV